jgi:uncharacterized membrane protein YvbJ
MKICKNTNCGCSNPDNAKFCSKCGGVFEETDLSKSDSGNESKIILTIIAIGATIAVIAVSGGIGTPIIFATVWGLKQIWSD